MSEVVRLIVQATIREATGSEPSQAQICSLVEHVMAELAERYAGEQVRVYVPMLTPKARGDRSRQIRADYNGRNTRELAARHGITERRVLQLVAK